MSCFSASGGPGVYARSGAWAAPYGRTDLSASDGPAGAGPVPGRRRCGGRMPPRKRPSKKRCSGNLSSALRPILSVIVFSSSCQSPISAGDVLIANRPVRILYCRTVFCYLNHISWLGRNHDKFMFFPWQFFFFCAVGQKRFWRRVLHLRGRERGMEDFSAEMKK